MSTSGVVSATPIATNRLLETAFRRCGVHPSKQTPELVSNAKQSLYMLLLGLANEGLNLWCVETHYVGLAEGQATYAAPAGTIDILNLVYTQPTRATGTDVVTANGVTTTLSSATTVVRVGVKFATVPASGTLTITGVDPIIATDWAANTWYWYEMSAATNGTVFSALFSSAATISEFYLASSTYDVPLTQWNRDTYSVLNDKHKQGRPCTSYYYEKKLIPQVTLWPVPNNNYDHLTLFTHRQVQDVGTLTQSIEVPTRWFEAICWQLASRIAFECELVDPQKIPMILQMADRSLEQVEMGETDGAPIYLTPNIGVYSR